MRFKTLIFLILSAFLISYSACKKEGSAPVIKFESIAPNPAIKYVDTIKIVISYSDADGDLGENTPDVKNLFVTDSRNNVTSEFRISQLAPDNSKIAIEGNLDVILSPQGFVNDSALTETVVYSVYVKDRAGHQSNTVQSSTLTINKQ